MEVRAAYGYDVDAASAASVLECLDKSLTQQHQKDDADINVIVARFGLTGKLPEPGSLPLVTNGDFVEALSFAEAQELMLTADRSFMALPAEVRERFANDAVKFVDFVSDPANVDEAVRLGLAVKKPEVPAAPPAG